MEITCYWLSTRTNPTAVPTESTQPTTRTAQEGGKKVSCKRFTNHERAPAGSTSLEDSYIGVHLFFWCKIRYREPYELPGNTATYYLPNGPGRRTSVLPTTISSTSQNSRNSPFLKNSSWKPNTPRTMAYSHIYQRAYHTVSRQIHESLIYQSIHRTNPNNIHQHHAIHRLFHPILYPLESRHPSKYNERNSDHNTNQFQP